MLWLVCLLVESLTTEYLMLLSTGFVARLVGNESCGGELLCDEDLAGGDRDARRDAGCSTGVAGPVSEAGGGVDGGSCRLPPPRSRSVGLLTDAPKKADGPAGVGSRWSSCSCSPCSWAATLSRPCPPSSGCSAGSPGGGLGSSAGGTGEAKPVPGFRIGNSSSAVDSFATPGLLVGNSPPFGGLGIGIGAEIVPRIDLCRGLARPAVEPDFPNMLGILVGAAGKPAGDGDGRQSDWVMGKREEAERRWAQAVDNKALVRPEPSDHNRWPDASALSRGLVPGYGLRG